MVVQISLQLSDEAEGLLRAAWGENLSNAVLEALVIEGYRSGRFGLGQVRRLLSLETRWDAETWLAERRVPLNYDLHDLAADRATLSHAFPPVS